jgi:DNA replication protein DnaC
MYGNVGKTPLSIALCIEPCKKGIETGFFRTTALVNRLSEAKKNGTELFGFLIFFNVEITYKNR